VEISHKWLDLLSRPTGLAVAGVGLMTVAIWWASETRRLPVAENSFEQLQFPELAAPARTTPPGESRPRRQVVQALAVASDPSQQGDLQRADGSQPRSEPMAPALESVGLDRKADPAWLSGSIED
jgi:hypothetical protein